MASIALSPSAPAAARSGSRGRFARVGLGTVVAAVLANVLVYALGAALVGYDPQFVVLANASGTILFTVVPATGAALLYAALRRFARRPARAFAIIAAVVLVASIVPDFTYIPTVPGATAKASLFTSPAAAARRRSSLMTSTWSSSAIRTTHTIHAP